MSSRSEGNPDERQQIYQRGTITLIRALVNRMEVLSPSGTLPNAQPAIEWLLGTAKERGCKSVYTEIESTLVAIVQDMEGKSFDRIPVELRAARTRLRALLDRVELLSSTVSTPGFRDAVEVVADNEDACIRLGRALIVIVQEYEDDHEANKARA